MRTQTMTEQFKSRIEELKTLRDEIRLDLHLASMDLRDEWKQLERNLPEDLRAAELKEASADALERLGAELRKFKARLGARNTRQVADVMKPAVSCRPGDTLAAAVTTMWNVDVGFLPVTDGEGRLLGVLTDRDASVAACTRGKRMDELPVEAVMTTDVVTCKQDDTLEQALEAMRGRQVRRLPVVDGEGWLAGVVTVNDVARAAPRGQAGEVLATYLGITAPAGEGVH